MKRTRGLASAATFAIACGALIGGAGTAATAAPMDESPAGVTIRVEIGELECSGAECGGSLAQTGPADGVLPAALGLVLAGAALVAVNRRSRAHE
ncbi:LPXTG cell wall anchor domain-containing protein [Agromyces laixinhei]|uniref:LPXTG cell wall anchor domain-containing protein n=1 Tax=Agromyces laixinhei TaxID=2585717 RepID=UPI0018DBA679|nr:LPXTG cell wall anchor domain-containing protein [Agromyces laixinhei]